MGESMAELHHKMGEGQESCGVKGCNNQAVRSLPTKRLVDDVGFELKDREQRRTHICKEHYKEYKKKTKDERLTDSLGWQR